MHLRGDLGHLDGDLGGRVAGSDHEHPPIPVRGRLAVVVGVHQSAGETLASRPVRQVRRPAQPGRHDHGRRGPFAGRGGQPPAVGRSIDPGDLDPELRTDAEPLGVRLEIAHQIVAGDPLTVVPRDRAPGNPERVRAVCSRRLSYRRRQAAPTASARSRTANGISRLPNSAATARPAAPAPMMIVCAATLAPYAGRGERHQSHRSSTFVIVRRFRTVALTPTMPLNSRASFDLPSPRL